MVVTVGADSLTLDIVKANLNIDFTSDDTLLDALIKQSLGYVRASTFDTVTHNTYVMDDPISTTSMMHLPTKPIRGRLEWSTDGTSGTVESYYPNSVEMDEFQTYMGERANVPGTNTVTQPVNVSINVYELFKWSLEKVGSKSTAIEIIESNTATFACEFFSGKLEDASIIERSRILLIGDWYNNREDSQYYRQNQQNHGVNAILDMLKSSSL